MKKFLSIILSLVLSLSVFSVTAEGNPPEPPDGFDAGQPPHAGTMDAPPDGFGGGKMGQPPAGKGESKMPPEGMGGPGGESEPEFYSAVYSYDADTLIAGEIVSSTAKDENALLITDGSVNVSDCTVMRNSTESTGGDSASFYGVGAAVLTTGGTVTIADSDIITDAEGGTGVFAYGNGVAYVSDCSITTKKGTSGGIHVAGGGTLYAKNLAVETDGPSAAAIRSDRGGGTMVVDGGTYISNGYGSPAVYVTADIAISDAELIATGAEVLCLEGKNSVALKNCNLTGNMPDQDQNDNTWTVILYQSMSGDAQIGEGTFNMEGGTLTSGNGGIFYTTNTDSVFTLKNVQINACEDSEYLLRCTGNSNARGWGNSGSNGANCTFNAVHQELNGNVIYDSISNLTLNLSEGSLLNGAILDDESHAGECGNGSCQVIIDEESRWVVTGDSVVSTLKNNGTIVDYEGKTVTVINGDGTILHQGDSSVCITVNEYSQD